MNQEPSHDDLPSEPSAIGKVPDGDSLLTAHALGELTDGDRTLVESRLRESPDDRHAVEQTARLGKILRQVAADQPLAERSPDLREAVMAALEGPPQPEDQDNVLAAADPPLLSTGRGAQLIVDGSDRVAADAGQAEPAVHLLERFPHRRFWLPLSLAASFLVVCGALFGLTKLKHTEMTVARNDSSPSVSEATVDVSDAEELSVLALEPAPVTEYSFGEPIETVIVDAPVGSAGDRSMLSANGGTTTGVPSVPDQASPATEAAPRFFSASLDGNRRGAAGGMGGFGAGGMPGNGMVGGGFGLEAQGGGQRSNRHKSARALGAAEQKPIPPTSLQPESGFKRSEGLEARRGRQSLHAEFADAKEIAALARANLEYKQLADNIESSAASTQVAKETKLRLAEARAKVVAAEAALATARGRGGPSAELAKAQADLVAAQASSRARDIEYLQIMQADSDGEVNDKLLEEAKQLSAAAKFKEQEARVRLGLLRASAGQPDAAIPDFESYPALVENPFLKPTEHPLSTFSIDVDTASYANVRRFLNSHGMPPADAVRIEELINYFQYDYPQPEGETPFSITTDVADCPWNAGHRLLRVGLKGREVPVDERPASNLVFLLDVSGSMSANNKLPLVKEAMYLLTDRLTENDRVAIVVYAGNSGLVLPPTNGTDKATIRQAIGQLAAGGSTNGGQGLQMAYDTAQSNFIKGGTNRVILATDGDFNVGIVDQNELVRFIEERAKSGVFLSALGFGVGNLKDGTLEKLADKGNGNYAYIDTLAEARRVLVEQLSGTLVTIAKDVKIQIEFNPAQTAEYRLIGYEDRVMPHQDFHDDHKDAGEIGAGHTVTALYEIVPAQQAVGPGGEPLKYQRSEALTPAADSGELATIKLRYKEPDGQQSRLLERTITDRRPAKAAASRDMSFAAAVAAFGMLLRDSPYRGDATFTKVLAWAEQGISSDTNGYRSEFLELVRLAREISGKE